jgi:hypothetical protein
MGLVSRSSGRHDNGAYPEGSPRSNKSPRYNGLSGNVTTISTGRLAGAVCAGNALSSLFLFSLLRSEPCQNSNHVPNYSSTFQAATSAQQLRGSQHVNAEATKEIHVGQDKDEVWSDFTHVKMRNHLKCSEFYQRNEQTIHDQDAWKLMRRTYADIVGADASTIGPPESGYNGFSRPYFVGHNDLGRGIYAGDNIPKDSLVWHNIRSAAFSEGRQFRQFVMALPRELGCDVLQWSYVMDDTIYCDLDEGSFCNDGYSEGNNVDTDKTASAKFITRAGMQLFATRDIKKGEELLCNYSSFSHEDWHQFGL